MRFQVEHSTHYTYTTWVTLGAHVLRLSPRRHLLTVETHQLSISPTPSSLATVVDAHGNELVHATFQGQTKEFSIHSAFDATTGVPVPLVDPGWSLLPWGPDAALGGAVDGSVSAFAFALAAGAGMRPLAFLDEVTRVLYQRMDRQVRVAGNAQSAVETLSSMRGACRDITVLFLEACRAVGIPGRFVSGYQAAAETPDGQRYLHAWPEVLLPAVGWRGWDATHGIRVADGHLALCAAPTQAETMPVEGGYGFVGATLTSNLKFNLQVRVMR